MRFHFGLGVGHVYSHHRATPAEHQREDSAGKDPAGDGDGDGDEDEDEDEDGDGDEDRDGDGDGDGDGDEEEDDGANAIERRSISSNESLSEQFDEMYDSEVDLDYEN
jgi:hypothetical protein